MAWVEHVSMGYETPQALTLTFTTHTWGIGLSIKHRNGHRHGQRRSLSVRILLGKWQWCFALGNSALYQARQ